ncbi:MAG: hypothetical protein IJI97_05805 [Clostridia bacterium]|nr:hypothetical protein [Clostridia bacterium]
MGILTRFDVDQGGCYDTNSYSEDEERSVIRDIGWFVIMGGEIRQYPWLRTRDGKKMTVVVEVRQGRYGGEDLTVWLWEWESK